MVSQIMTKDREQERAKEKGEKRKSGRLVTEKMEETADNQWVKDSKEMVSWRSINQEEIDEVWKSWP